MATSLPLWWPLLLTLLLALLLLAYGHKHGPLPLTAARANVLAGLSVALLLLWQLKAAIHPLLALHFLGLTTLTLVAGARLALLAGLLLAAVNGLWHSQLALLPLNLLCLVCVPVLASRTALFVVKALLPAHLFLYIFIAGFGGAAVAICLGYGSRALLLVLYEQVSSRQALEQNIQLLPLLAFPEALLNGMAVTLMAVYRPHWLATFNERRLLG